jgi:acyl-CoA synthetase (AMP-forming)/AMP-acid ligase II
VTKTTAESIAAALTVPERILLFCLGSEAAVFMTTSSIGVGEVWAAIVCSEKIDTESLRAHCLPSMPAVFVPRHIAALDALPVGATGKVDRSRLKQMVTNAARS